MTRLELKRAFPWLGQDEQVSGADTVQELAELYARLPAELEPAVLKRDKLICACGNRDTPRLSEHGYVLTHHVVSVQGKKIKARGWDGGSHDMSEEGDHYTLDCAACFKEHAFPEGIELDWI